MNPFTLLLTAYPVCCRVKYTINIFVFQVFFEKLYTKYCFFLVFSCFSGENEHFSKKSHKIQLVKNVIDLFSLRKKKYVFLLESFR